MKNSRIGKVDEAIGARIRSRRLALGRSQTWLAERLGVSFQQVQKYELGANRVSGSRLVAIGQALEIGSSELLGDDRPAARNESDLLALMSTREGVAIAKAFPRLAPALRRQFARTIVAAATR